MKKILLVLGLGFSTLNVFSQEVNYKSVEKGSAMAGKYTSYVSKNGSVYKIGDKIDFGLPSGTNGEFILIKKMDITGTMYIVGSEAINTSAELKKIRVTGNSRRGYKVNFQTKGFTGVDNYFFDIEDALKVGEIKSLVMSSDEALTELKKAKDKLDLDLITQDEYNKIKTELSKLIK